jgi:hypothetical protein
MCAAVNRNRHLASRDAMQALLSVLETLDGHRLPRRVHLAHVCACACQLREPRSSLCVCVCVCVHAGVRECGVRIL